MKALKIFILLSIFTLSNLFAGKWTRINDLNSVRAGFGCVILTDGRILVFGSESGSTFETFDPATGKWTQGNITGANGGHPATILLPNGKVWFVPPDSVASIASQVYDPVTNTWSAGPSISYYEKSASTLLNNGKVLITGYDCATPYTRSSLYDYQSNSLSLTGSTSVLQGDRTIEVLLHTGEALVIGGGAYPQNTELYNPASGVWSNMPNTPYGSYGGCGIRLPTPWNYVLVAGPGAQAQLFDPGTHAWAATGNLSSASRGVPAMTMLPMGKPMMIGGQVNETCELYDPALGVWTSVESMNYKRSHFSAPLLYTGKVLAVAGKVTGSLDITNTAEVYDTTISVWGNKPSLSYARAGHTITPLPITHTTNCSTNVLIVGGENSLTFLNSCELYNYTEERVAPTVALATQRAYHTANLLASGNVLIGGGKNAGGALKSCELYSINAGSCTWSPTGDMLTSRFNHTATLLKNGKVFITGGENISGVLSSCETYNNNSGTWSAANPMTNPRTEHTCVLLLDGRVLVIGGRTSAGVTTGTCEIYNPTSGNWANTGSLTTPRSLHNTILLQSGKVLAIGGKSNSGTALSSCEIYDPATAIWSTTQTLNTARYMHNSILIYSGLVLTMGGYDGTNYLSSCELYDPLLSLTFSPTWQQTKPLNTARAMQGCCNIPELKPYVLSIAGTSSGSNFLNSIEEYDIGLGYIPEWQSTITNYKSITHISNPMNIQGTLFRGVTEADGGNHCHIVSSDHPIISLLRIPGGNWQSNGGGEALYMPYSDSWSETNTNVHPIIADSGHCMLWAIVNAIPTKWYEGCIAGKEEFDNIEHKAINTSLELRSNPITQTTTIWYQITNKSKVTMRIYDATGRLTTSIIDEIKDSGVYNINVNTKKFISGIYFVTLSTKNFKATKKLVLIK
ncbi:MAG: kelch repeat-containing protein [bacterium]|nr:kelch repeat-containing protein [bacterium]